MVLRDVLDSVLVDLGVEEGQRIAFCDRVLHAVVKLHPCQLGALLLEVQAAREVRYNAPHPDYWNPLQTCLRSEVEPRQKIARFDEAHCRRMLSQARSEFERLRWLPRE